MESKYKLVRKKEAKFSKKGLLIGAGIAVLLLFALLTWSLEMIILVTIVLTIASIFFYPDGKSQRVIKKHKYLILSFVMILSVFLTTILASRSHFNEFEGNVFTDQTNPGFMDGYLFGGGDSFSQDLVDLPNHDYFYQARTSSFGQINFTIDLTVRDYAKLDFNDSFIMVWCYNDLDINGANLISDHYGFSLEEQASDLHGVINISHVSKAGPHYQINYLFKIFLEIKSDRYYNDILAQVKFSSNKNDSTTYSYNKVSTSLSSGILYEGSAASDLLKGPVILYLYTSVILFVYLFIMVLCFVWQRFEITKFMMMIYLLLGIVVFFWYISYVIEDPTRAGLPDVFSADWVVIFANFNLIRDLIILVIAIAQWVFSVGIILLIMLKITMVFGTIFDADKASEQYEIKIALKELASAIK